MVGERLRQQVEQTDFPHGKTQPLGAVTISIGLCELSDQMETPAEVIYAADRALYMAKSRGKNCIQESE